MTDKINNPCNPGCLIDPPTQFILFPSLADDREAIAAGNNAGSGNPYFINRGIVNNTSFLGNGLGNGNPNFLGNSALNGDPCYWNSQCNPCAGDPLFNPPVVCGNSPNPCKKKCKKRCDTIQSNGCVQSNGCGNNGGGGSGSGSGSGNSNCAQGNVSAAAYAGRPGICGSGGCVPSGYGPGAGTGCCGTDQCSKPNPCLGPCQGQKNCGVNPCPLKSFCDPGLSNSCAARPLINPVGPRKSVTTWTINYLVSNRANLAAHSDEYCVNPWGITIYNNQVWVANGGTDTITCYDLYGNKIMDSITIRSATQNSSYPTGIAINCNGGFGINPAVTINSNVSRQATRTSLLLVAAEHGTVNAYNPTIDPLNSFVVLNKQNLGEVCVFKGLAIVNNILYLADFLNNRIDVFDSNYIRLNDTGPGFVFIDGYTADPIPRDFAPNNIVHIGCYLYVPYSKKTQGNANYALDGPTNGYISVFNLDGSFVRRFTSRGVLNNPWAIIPAPCECGYPPGSLLVSNTGDGRINVFDCSGGYIGPLLGRSGLPLVIEGVRGLVPHYTDFNEIYLTAAANDNTDGIVACLTKDQVITF